MSNTINPDTATNDELEQADTTTLLRTLRDEMEADSVGIVVEDTPVGVRAGVTSNTGKGSRFNPFEVKMAEVFIDRFDDMLVALYKTDADGLDLWWEIGELIDEHGIEDEYVTYEWFDVFGEPVGLDQQDFEYADKIHSVFDARDEIPGQDWDDETWVGRLAHVANDKDEARRLVNAFENKPSKRDIRLWKDVRDTDDPDVEDVVEAAQRRYKAKYGYDDGTWVKKTQAMYRALGRDTPDRETVEAALDD